MKLKRKIQILFSDTLISQRYVRRNYVLPVGGDSQNQSDATEN
jgi:hypothetical protein